MKKILFILFLGSVILTSCRDKILEYPLYFEGEKLVVFGFFLANEPIKISISKTWPPAGIKPTNIIINDAEVSIFKNGLFLENLYLKENGIYLSRNETKIIEGAKYQVFVNSKSLGKVESKIVEVPLIKPNISYQKSKNTQPEHNQDINQDLIELKLVENKEGRVYYYVTFQNLYLQQQQTAQYWSVGESMNKPRNDCDFGASVFFNETLNNANVFSNDCFINKEKQLKYSLEAGFNISVDNKIQFVKPYKVNIKVATISKDYFEYLKNQYQPIDVERIFKDPTTNFTNIKGGYGIIATANEVIESYNYYENAFTFNYKYINNGSK
jgi:hypothetical protein